jgi:hypothetical protein
MRKYILFIWAVLSIIGFGPWSEGDAYKGTLPTLISVCKLRGNAKIHWRATSYAVTHLVAILIIEGATLLILEVEISSLNGRACRFTILNSLWCVTLLF